jgi:hypothetical protein
VYSSKEELSFAGELSFFLRSSPAFVEGLSACWICAICLSFAAIWSLSCRTTSPRKREPYSVNLRHLIPEHLVLIFQFLDLFGRLLLVDPAGLLLLARRPFSLERIRRGDGLREFALRDQAAPRVRGPDSLRDKLGLRLRLIGASPFDRKQQDATAKNRDA